MPAMNARRPLLRCVLPLAAVLATAGCQSFPSFSDFPTPGEMMHNLKPHRLARLNRAPKPGRDAFFSVSDPLADESTEACRD
jgi:hypothetical protein